MKLIGRLLMVTAMLTTVTAFVGSEGAGAVESSKKVAASVPCVGLLFGNPLNVPAAENVETLLTGPSFVVPGAKADFAIQLGGSPGFKNGPVPFSDGLAVAWVALNGDQANLVETPVVTLPTPIGANTVIEFPKIIGTVPSITATTTIEVARVRYWNSQASVTCTIPVADRAKVTVQPAVTTTAPTTAAPTTAAPTTAAPTTAAPTTAAPTTAAPTTAAPTTAAPTTAAPTTAAPTTAAPTTAAPTTAAPTTAAPTTAAPTTSTTAPAGGLDYDEASVSSFMKCTLKYPSFPAEGIVLPSGTEMTVTLQAPKEATAGKPYTVFMYIEPGLETGIGLDAGAVAGAVTELSVSSPGTPATVVTGFPDLTNPAAVPAGGYVKIPVSEAVVNAAGTVGQSITVTAKSFAIKTGAFAGNNPGSVSCVPDSAPKLTTKLVEREFVDTTPPTPPPTQTPTTAPVVPAAPATPAAPAAPVTAGASAGVQAQVIEKSAQVTYKCEIYAGSNLITTQNDTQTVTIKTVDKVAPGGTLSFQMSLAPGPKTGPVALPAGVQNVALGATAGGPASPSLVAMSAGNLSAPVGTNSNIIIPTVSGSTKATGSDGESITLTAANMRFETARPPSRTECTAVDPPVITTTAIVTGVEVDAATAEQLAATGNGRGWLLPLAIVQLAVGLGLVLMQHSRRRTA